VPAAFRERDALTRHPRRGDIVHDEEQNDPREIEGSPYWDARAWDDGALETLDEERLDDLLLDSDDLPAEGMAEEIAEEIAEEVLPSEIPDERFGERMRAGELQRGYRRHLDAVVVPRGTVKIVYWGPGRSGKTTNVKWLHRRLRPELRGQVLELDTPGERTLYFDSLPLELDCAGGAPVRLRLFTVPGQPRHRVTRQLVLQEVDGIVFVWDSRSRRLNANLASLLELRESLAEAGLVWGQIPRVIQYNKQDLDERLSPEELDHVLDRMGEHVPRLASVAVRGAGVLETLGAVARGAVKRHLAYTGTLRDLAPGMDARG
jgi:signal recognition particle receptor subunit beta